MSLRKGTGPGPVSGWPLLGSATSESVLVSVRVSPGCLTCPVTGSDLLASSWSDVPPPEDMTAKHLIQFSQVGNLGNEMGARKDKLGKKERFAGEEMGLLPVLKETGSLAPHSPQRAG